MSDYISRQAAIDALMVRDKELRNINWYDKPFAEGECKGIDYALEIVNALPSAQPERKRGEWVVDDEFIDCSVCRREKWSRIPYGDLVRRFRYCPNCGAEMRRDE